MDVSTVLDLGASAALAWTETTTSGETSAPTGFNWLLFAEAAAANVHESLHKGRIDEAESWAKAAIRVYEQLGSQYRWFGADISAQMLRAVFIKELGPQPDHPLRDLAKLSAWFLDGVEVPRAEAEATAKRLRRLAPVEWTAELESLRMLRRIKNKLAVFLCLDASTLSAEIRQWLSIRALLP